MKKIKNIKKSVAKLKGKLSLKKNAKIDKTKRVVAKLVSKPVKKGNLVVKRKKLVKPKKNLALLKKVLSKRLSTSKKKVVSKLKKIERQLPEVKKVTKTKSPKLLKLSKEKLSTRQIESTPKPKLVKKVKVAKVAIEKSYMDEAQLKHYRELLLERKQQLIEEINRAVEDLQAEAVNFADPVDRAAQEEKFNLELKTRDRERKLIKKIDEALERISRGDYGYCVDCGAEISLERLNARPTATQCIECKIISELREKQTGS